LSPFAQEAATQTMKLESTFRPARIRLANVVGSPVQLSFCLVVNEKNWKLSSSNLQIKVTGCSMAPMFMLVIRPRIYWGRNHRAGCAKDQGRFEV